MRGTKLAGYRIPANGPARTRRPLWRATWAVAYANGETAHHTALRALAAHAVASLPNDSRSA